MTQPPDMTLRAGREVRDEAAALRAESRQARRRAAEVHGEGTAILDAVGQVVTSFLLARGFALSAPVVARWRTVENGNTGVEITARLQDPGAARDARAALADRFPDRLSKVNVS